MEAGLLCDADASEFGKVVVIFAGVAFVRGGDPSKVAPSGCRDAAAPLWPHSQEVVGLDNWIGSGGAAFCYGVL